MEKPTLTIPDQRMLELLDLLLANGEIRFRQEFLDAIGMQKQNYRRVILGTQHFTVEQIIAACEAYGADGNWILGLKGGKKFIPPKAKPAKGLSQV